MLLFQLLVQVLNLSHDSNITKSDFLFRGNKIEISYSIEKMDGFEVFEMYISFRS